MAKKNNLRLLWTLAKTDFKLRYYGSVLGYFWSLLKPFVMFLVLYVVFSLLVRFDQHYYQLYLLLGILIWNFFAEATIQGMNSLLSKGHIIKKVYISKFLIVFSSTITAFISFILNLIVFFLIYVFLGPGFDWIMLMLPIYLILIYFLALGFALLLSVLNVYFRDISQIWELFLQVGFYVSPIIYPLAIVPSEYVKYLFINPLTGIIQYSRILLIDHDLPSFKGSLYLLFVIFVLFIFAYFIFRKYSKFVTEKI